MVLILENYSIHNLAISHKCFELIHPFQDGNGRIGRMLIFRQCLDNNIVPCIITEDMDKSYKKSLQEATYGEGEVQLERILEQASEEYYNMSKRFVEQYEKYKNK